MVSGLYLTNLKNFCVHNKLIIPCFIVNLAGETNRSRDASAFQYAARTIADIL